MLVALHGHQDDPVALAARLATLPEGLHVVTPRSTIDDGGPVWFRSDEHGPVEADLLASLDQIEAAITDACAEGGFGRDQVVVGGFSQGGATALALVLRGGGGESPVAGVFCVSGWLPHADAIAYDASALAAGGTRALVVHGADDEVVAVQQGRSAARYLDRHGVTTRFVELPGDHHLGAEAIDELGAWLG